MLTEQELNEVVESLASLAVDEILEVGITIHDSFKNERYLTALVQKTRSKDHFRYYIVDIKLFGATKTWSRVRSKSGGTKVTLQSITRCTSFPQIMAISHADIKNRDAAKSLFGYVHSAPLTLLICQRFYAIKK